MAGTRRRVAIERIAGDAARQVSFSKRRQGLFKKACELSTLCGAESAVLVHSPAGRVYSLGDPDVLSVVDRFLLYASRPVPAAAPAPAPAGEEPRGGAGGGRRRQASGPSQAEGRRRFLEEELYRLLAQQESWLDAATAYRAAMAGAVREKEGRLPHPWGAKVQDVGMKETEEMADALEDLALKVGDLITEMEEQEGVPQNQRWSPDAPAPPPANPWRQAMFMAALGQPPAPPAPVPAAMAPFPAPPAFDQAPPQVDPAALGAGALLAPAAPMGTNFWFLENPMAPNFLGGGPGVAGPMGPEGPSGVAGLANTVGAASFGLGRPPPPPPPPVLSRFMQARRDGEGSSSGSGPFNNMF